jgi:protease YdgD
MKKILLAVALLAAAPAYAQPIVKKLLPGIGVTDKRVRIDPQAPPWRGIGRIQANAPNLRRTCTGVLVGPQLLLTAAHCVFNSRTEAFFPPPALHFLLGYSQGAFVAHAQGTGIIVAPGWDPNGGTGSDWALVTLDQPLGTADRLVGFASAPPAAGQAAMIAGYSGDFVEVITADTSCHIVGFGSDAAGHRFLRHDCAATQGASGAPLFVREGTGWRIAGIEVGASVALVGGVASSVDAVIQAMRGQKPNM